MNKEEREEVLKVIYETLVLVRVLGGVLPEETFNKTEHDKICNIQFRIANKIHNLPLNIVGIEEGENVKLSLIHGTMYQLRDIGRDLKDYGLENLYVHSVLSNYFRRIEESYEVIFGKGY